MNPNQFSQNSDNWEGYQQWIPGSQGQAASHQFYPPTYYPGNQDAWVPAGNAPTQNSADSLQLLATAASSAGSNHNTVTVSQKFSEMPDTYKCDNCSRLGKICRAEEHAWKVSVGTVDVRTRGRAVRARSQSACATCSKRKLGCVWKQAIQARAHGGDPEALMIWQDMQRASSESIPRIPSLPATFTQVKVEPDMNEEEDAPGSPESIKEEEYTDNEEDAPGSPDPDSLFVR